MRVMSKVQKVKETLWKYANKEYFRSKTVGFGTIGPYRSMFRVINIEAASRHYIPEGYYKRLNDND